MKILLFLLFVSVFPSMISAQAQEPLISTVQDSTVKDVLSGNPMLLGYCNRTAFQDTSYSWWFNSMYDVYNIDTVSAAGLKDKLNNIDIRIVMGTWCSDSRREVPRLFKILDYLNYPSDSVKILTVGRNLKGKAGETDGLNIEKVPTIIFYRGGKEIGRIIESPKVSLEKDMLKILD